MEMPRLSDGHRRLERLAGDWRGEETMPPSQWDPNGGTAQGRSHSRLDLGGFALVTDYEQTRDRAVTFAGHGVMTYDADDDTYTLHWFDCLGTAPEVFRGRFEGDTLTVSHGGPGMHARLTYDTSDPDHLVSRMEMSQDGEAWKPLFEARYQRA
jgi:Protein of unknown function (DUF1579)